jgi:hypothetical protein
MKQARTVVLLFVACWLGQQAWSAEPSKPSELEVLRKFVGTWDCDVVMKPAVWTPKEVREKAVEVNTMTLDGWFLHGTSKTADGKTLAILMNTYDPVQQKFRIWRFAAGGSCEELSGKWNATTNTLTIMTDLGHGITSTATFHLIDKDHRNYRVVAKDSDGKVYLDIQGTVVRRKQLPDRQMRK